MMKMLSPFELFGIDATPPPLGFPIAQFMLREKKGKEKGRI